MANIEHKDLGYAEQHVIHFKEYADATAREGATGLTSDDNGKIALQLDNGSYWRLTDYSGPTWANIAQLQVGDVTKSHINTDVAGTGLSGGEGSALSHDPHTGDVTGATELTIGAQKVLTAHLKDANVTLAKLADDAKFASGTVMLFGQSAAPTGWTKKMDWTNYAMLIYTTGNISGGGSVDPTAVHTHGAGSYAGPSHTHTISAHNHQWLNNKAVNEHDQTYDSEGNAQTLPDGSGTKQAAHRRLLYNVSGDSELGDAYTSNDGDGNTGSSGTGSITGSSGENTQPYYQMVIAATKN